jgi:transposase InsO family protein
MMNDADVVAVSPSTTYRVLKNAGLLDRTMNKPSKKGTGFKQPEKPHNHWHIDISYLNLGGTFYFLISVLDGYSRFIVHWDICESMREQDVELVLQKALEKYPDAKPRIISDNGPQFIAKDFKSFLRIFGLSHARTSPYYPQSNGKLERWHGSLKDECIRPSSPQTVAEAIRRVTDYVQHYNEVRLHSAIDYVTPADKLAGRAVEINRARDLRLEAARDIAGTAAFAGLGSGSVKLRTSWTSSAGGGGGAASIISGVSALQPFTDARGTSNSSPYYVSGNQAVGHTWTFTATLYEWDPTGGPNGTGDWVQATPTAGGKTKWTVKFKAQ